MKSKKAALAAVACAALLLPATRAGASGTYKTYTGQAFDYTQQYCVAGACVLPTVTFTSHFETTLTNPPYGYFCKTPRVGLGSAGSTCWYAGSNELWANQTVELLCYDYDPDTTQKVVKMAWGLTGQTKPSRIGFYIAAGERATSAEENSTGHC